MKNLLTALAIVLLLVPFAPAQRSSSRSSSRSSPGKAAPTIPKARSVGAHTRSNTCTSCARDSRGRIARSSTARAEFRKSHPCPATGKTTGACTGFMIDHVVPLKRAGADDPSNMQWQTTAAAKTKHKVE
jgi:hypothetical protein